jgi:hypothetical protein
MARINAIAKAHGLKVIEDCAQAHGAESDLGRVGALGGAAAFSFQSSRNLTCGEGGVVTTNSRAIAEGVPCLAGYREPLSDSPAIQEDIRRSPGFVRVMDCPNTRNVCACWLWFAQNRLLAGERDMDDIVAAR